MSDDASPVAWPSAASLVQRAELSLNIVRPRTDPDEAAPLSVSQALVVMQARLAEFEQGYSALVPPGFESAGRLAFMKRFFKKVTRRLVWWYVEPRWTIQRQITAELASFARSSIQVNRALSAEVDELRAQLGELQRTARGRAT